MVNGKKIRGLRENKNLSTTDLAEIIGISQSMIVFIERGVKPPSIEVLKRIADYFKCTVDELLVSDKTKTS